MIRELPKFRLRSWLLIALTFALIPVLLLSISQTVDGLRKDGAQRVEQLAQESRYIAAQIDNELTRVADLIEVLASETPGTADCEQVYENLEELVHAVTFVVRAKASGETVCAWPETNAAPLAPFGDLSRFTPGNRTTRTDVMFGQRSNTHIIGVATAIMAGDEVEEVFSVSLDVAEFSKTATQSIRSEDIKFGLVDSDGIVFDHPVLTQVSIDEIRNSAAADQIQISEQIDGRFTVIARAIEGTDLFAVLYRPAPSWGSLILSQPGQLALLPLLAIVSVFLAVWWAIESLVLKWLRRLQRVSDIYGAGRLSLSDEETMARAPLEVANLATGMDEMANRIAQRQDELESAIIMRDAAVKETHHRVKNNLQIVSSFLSLEARNAEFVETKEVLQKARNRISALSIVHQTLYQHERVAEVHTKPFLELLLPHLEAALLMEDRQISLSFAIDDALISSDDANPLALLILELITNSVKHAFDEQGGEIIVELKDLSEDLAMTVTDNGIGETESSHKRSGTGSRLINAFVRQLSGKIEVDTDDGRRTHVVFPKK